MDLNNRTAPFSVCFDVFPEGWMEETRRHLSLV